MTDQITQELKEALRLAIRALELTPDYGIRHSSVKDDDKAATVLRAYLDKFYKEKPCGRSLR